LIINIFQDAFLPKSTETENEMSIEIPTRILTVPRNLINMKEYEELVICFKMETKLSFSFFG